MSVPHSSPDKCKQRLIELLRGQTSQGYALHLFDPDWFDPEKRETPAFRSPTVVPTPQARDGIHGLKDTCSDDALWVVGSVCDYIKETGEFEFFDRIIPFADGGEATVYEHLRRALDFSGEQIGPHGVCKGLRADWNDCLNLGGGESAMVSFMHYWALGLFVEAAEYLCRPEDVEKYSALQKQVRETAERELWDGEWYIRGITSKGLRIGSAASDEGEIFLESNAWAVLSGAASEEHGRMCMQAVRDKLGSEYGLHLLWPAFSEPNDDIGFITRVITGIKENAAIFSHPNPWAVVAECRLGHGREAFELYDALLPYNYNDRAQIREAEPYSYCQFIIGRDHPAFGRARHPWLTGSAGWSYVAATRWILGIRPEFNGLTIDPCIPRDWKEFQVTRKWRGATFNIHVVNADGVENGVRSAKLNGWPVSLPVPPQPAGSVNEIVVEMGKFA